SFQGCKEGWREPLVHVQDRSGGGQEVAKYLKSYFTQGLNRTAAAKILCRIWRNNRICGSNCESDFYTQTASRICRLGGGSEIRRADGRSNVDHQLAAGRFCPPARIS